MDEIWITYDHDDRLKCPCCDGDVEILTNLSTKEISMNIYQDSDLVRCTEKDCDLINAQVSADDDDVYINGEW